MDRAPTMNIHKTPTTLSRVDPLKHVFRGIFDALPDGARGHVVAIVGEFLGTLCFIFFAFAGGEVAMASSKTPDKTSNSTQTSLINPSILLKDGDSPPTTVISPSLFLYVSLSAGFSLLIFAWIFFRVSGGLFNPVVSLGMALIGAITWVRCAILTVTQFVATIAAAYMVNALFNNGGLNVATKLGEQTTVAQGVLIEMILTAQLVFTVFMLAAEKHAATFLAPIGIGLSLFIAELVGVYWTGGSLNPARSLAPCIVNNEFTSYHWIYWVGPIAGTILAVLIFKLVKALEYETLTKEEKQELLPRPNAGKRRASSTIPLASIHSVEMEPTRAPQAPRKPMQKEVMEEGQNLPTCLAD